MLPLKKRFEFKRAARGVRAEAPAFLIQSCAAPPPGPETARIGFTVTKKIGNAVVRNRIRRRLRAAVSAEADVFRSSTDYVLVARRPALSCPFPDLISDLRTAVPKLHARLDRRERRPRTAETRSG